MILRPIGPLKTLRREPFGRSSRQGDCHGRWQFHSPYSARHAGQRTLLHGAASFVRANLDTQRSKAEGVLEWQQDVKKGEKSPLIRSSCELLMCCLCFQMFQISEGMSGPYFCLTACRRPEPVLINFQVRNKETSHGDSLPLGASSWSNIHHTSPYWYYHAVPCGSTQRPHKLPSFHWVIPVIPVASSLGELWGIVLSLETGSLRRVWSCEPAAMLFQYGILAAYEFPRCNSGANVFLPENRSTTFCLRVSSV